MSFAFDISMTILEKNTTFLFYHNFFFFLIFKILFCASDVNVPHTRREENKIKHEFIMCVVIFCCYIRIHAAI